MSLQLNQVNLGGRLTRDPELRYTPKGTAVAKIGMVVNRTWKSESGEAKEEGTFVDVDAFGRTAENVGQYLRKGSEVLVIGRLRLDSWDDKATGQKRSKLGVVADSVQFIGARKEESPAIGNDAPKADPSPISVPDPVSDAAPVEDDVPF